MSVKELGTDESVLMHGVLPTLVSTARVGCVVGFSSLPVICRHQQVSVTDTLELFQVKNFRLEFFFFFFFFPIFFSSFTSWKDRSGTFVFLIFYYPVWISVLLKVSYSRGNAADGIGSAVFTIGKWNTMALFIIYYLAFCKCRSYNFYGIILNAIRRKDILNN